MKYTAEQQKLIDYTREKVEKLFENYTDPAHGTDHIFRVVDRTVKIARGEKARSPFLCELAALTHDIGRTREDNPGENSRKHHELSYIILREWFKDDRQFDILIDEEKKELLYTVRYHWNNVADDYDSAWILRDADKLDAYGEVGINRMSHLCSSDEDWNSHLRHVYETYVHVRTKTAKKMIKKEKLMDAVEKKYKTYLESKIEPVELP
ncbi:hypothetical protein C0581_00950 [Candidatus Parcubacteria bacterium]|nr:MAG: hypothetical protein C0581_00950 [Candidatus Parcubacteria bacterium]